MKKIILPPWAEDIITRWGPQPAYRAEKADPHAVARYTAVADRFRSRWMELKADVWVLFDGLDDDNHRAQVLLGAMVDLARYGTVDEFAHKRQALEDLQQIEDELRDLAALVRRKLIRRSDIMREHLLDGGIDDAALQPVEQAVDNLLAQTWSEPRLLGAPWPLAPLTRKTQRDGVLALLGQLDILEPLLRPVRLTDRARATLYNVVNDTHTYSAAAMKKARADLRAR